MTILMLEVYFIVPMEGRIKPAALGLSYLSSAQRGKRNNDIRLNPLTRQMNAIVT